MFKIGVIGPEDLVEQAKEISKSYNDIEAVDLAYQEKSAGANYREAFNHVKKSNDSVQAFLFTGPLPYYKILKKGITDRYLFYYPIYGTAIYKTLFKMSVHDKIDIEKISIDTIKRDNIINVYEDLDLKTENIRLNKTKIEDFSYKSFFDFHKKLYKTGKTKAAVTAVKSIYEGLKSINVPTYRITPTFYTVKRTFEFINSFIEKNVIGNKVAIIKVKIVNSDIISSSYDNLQLKQKEIALYQRLLEFARNNFGIIYDNNGEYQIILNQDMLRNLTDDFSKFSLAKEVEEKISKNVVFGIGLGKEVIRAQERSQKAFNMAYEDENNNTYIVGSSKQVYGPLENADITNQYSSSQKEEILKLSNSSGLSADKIVKINDLLKHKNDNKVTAKELAQYLSVSLRTGNRIIKKLKKSSLAREVGQQQSVKRGRPSRIYEINFTLN